MLALKAQMRTQQTEIQSLQRRNQDLEMLVQEKEYLLQDVIAKFKKERSSLKSRIMKLEQRMNQMTYDASLDIKPAKGSGSKSVQQHPQDDFDSKSEIAVAKSHIQPKTQKKRSN